MKLALSCIIIILVLTCGCTSQSTECPTKTSCDGINLSMVKFQVKDRQSFKDPFIFTGTVQNIDNCTIKQATVGINLYDDQGYLLDTVNTSISCINPGETKDFSLHYSGNKLESIQNYEWYYLVSREWIK